MPDNQFAISTQNLNFSYGGPPILKDISLQLPYGSRCLLVGCNGVGKSTLLRILAGKRLVRTPVMVLGFDAYHQTSQEIAYLGAEWAANPVVRTDVAVSSLLVSMGESEYPDRAQRLIDLLDIDRGWHMHQVSDGERRRVQIMLGLLKPFRCLLLDEVTVDLDVVVRRNLLDFLKNECQNSTILYATHIFDGLGDWPTHVAHMNAGTIVDVVGYDQLRSSDEFAVVAKSEYAHLNSPLLSLVEMWLRSDFEGARKRKRELDKADTKWNELSENAKKYGDKFYNYWTG